MGSAQWINEIPTVPIYVVGVAVVVFDVLEGWHFTPQTPEGAYVDKACDVGVVVVFAARFLNGNVAGF